MLNYKFTEHPLNNQSNTCAGYGKSIFIPAYSWNETHYYFLIDFRNQVLKRWEFSVRLLKNALREYLADKYNYIMRQDLLEPFNFSMNPHSAIVCENYVYVFMVNSYFFIRINLSTNLLEMIALDHDRMISSTNQIVDGYLYLGTYNVGDRIQNILSEQLMPSEINCYCLETGELETLNTFQSCNIIHSVAVSRNGEALVAINTTADPYKPFQKNSRYKYSVSECKEMLAYGIKPSQVHIFDRRNKQEKTVDMYDSPAHFEPGLSYGDFGYISCHSLGVNPYDGFVYCMGRAAIKKMDMQNGTVVSEFGTEDFSRIPSHKVFLYNDEEYIAVSGYYKQLYILKCQDMSCYKQIPLDHDSKIATLQEGIYKYPRLDYTPFAVHPIDGKSSLFLVGGRDVKLYDFSSEEFIGKWNYNLDSKPISLLGHSIMF